MESIHGFEGRERDGINAVLAVADLVDRAGATHFDMGFDEGDSITWHAQAFYRGARLFVGGQPTPEVAATALAVELLTGAACKCGQKVSLRPEVPGCLWRLEGRRWVPGCDAPAIELPEEQRGNVAALRGAVNERTAERERRAS